MKAEKFVCGCSLRGQAIRLCAHHAKRIRVLMAERMWFSPWGPWKFKRQTA